MSPKVCRLLFVAALVTGVSAPMFGAYAAGQNRSVDAYNMPRGFEAPAKSAYQPLDINKDDTVRWNIIEGEHTVKPKDAKQWAGTGSDGTLTPESVPYTKKFTTPDDYFYYCDIHGGRDEDGNLTGMWGVIHVIDPTPTTTAPPPPPPPPPPPASSSTTTTTRPSATPPATSATAPTTRPTPTTAAPTTTAPKADKKPKDETSTTTMPALTPPPPPIDLPDEAIIPTLPGANATSSAEPGAPGEAPEGEAVALLKGKKDGGNAMKLLIVSGLGLGALGIGSAGYKYANRSSKYFPA